MSTKTTAAPDATNAAPAKKAAVKKTAAKTAKKAAGESKTATVIKMLTGAKKVTRADIVAATGWQVDLKALCARKGMRLKKDAEGYVSATPPKA